MKRNKTLLVYFYFLKLIRIPNLIIIAISQWAVTLLLLSDSPFDSLNNPKLHLLVLCSVLTGAAGYVINDYYDIKIDWVNKPQRVVVSRFIERRYALILHSVFNFIALLLSLFIGWKIFISILLTEILLWWYSNELKRLAFWGNFVVALLSAYSLLLPGFILGKFTTPLWFFAGFAFIISFIRELIKDVEDLDGDARYGCSTLAITLGISGAKKIIYILVILLITGVASFAYLYYDQSLLLYCTLILAPLFLFLIFRIAKAKTSSDFNFLSTLCKFIMLAGMLTMVFN